MIVHNRANQRGQALVLLVGGMVTLIAMIAAIIDGGNAWAQQRIVQNGSDAAAEAGAIVMAQRFAEATAPSNGSCSTPDECWDAEVSAKVQATLAANGIVAAESYYTDICGIPLQPDGSKALNPDGTEDLSVAALVGSGSVPTSTSTTVDCPSLTQGPPAGVLVVGQKDVQTYLAPIVGINQLRVSTRATAVSGYLQGFCDATQGNSCALLPVTIPTSPVTCDGSNNAVLGTGDWTLGPVYVVPLCGNSPGNVGWLDWTPPGGGTSELVCSILTPNNPSIDLPSWKFITSTGNTNGGGGTCSMNVQEAIRTYDGEVVMIPQFDNTCNPKNSDPDPNSTKPAVETPPDFGCPIAVNTTSAGQNLWYRIKSFAFFQLCSASDPDCVALGTIHGGYMHGQDDCPSVGGNGSTSCLVGKFVKILKTGTVGPGVGAGAGGEKAIGVQLIK